MSEKLNELKKKLREIFQLDQTDLDFGIYKIMNEKSAEITDFLENKLLKQVKDSFKSLENEDKTSIQKELDEAISQAKSLGINPDDSPKVKELKAQLTNSVDISVLENDVYSHLTNFFSRYYNGGDFMSLRRYKKDVYAIPYEGEEVKLHWANSDQYYIKTSENFKDYSFFIGEDENKKTVHFKLVEAETEKDNNKSDKERRFMLVEENPIYIQDDELYILFEYKIDENKKQQKFYNDIVLEKLLPELQKEEYSGFNGLLAIVPTEKNKNRTLLEKHLTDYTAKNSFDYFIHKDLGGFLNRELDFYIKNEVLNLDDLDEKNIQKNLGKAKAIKEIAKKLITFLAQLEDFQKKLWLKKKFVVETNYCITLDKVDEKFYPEIVNNKEQLEEWEKLFAISEIKTDLPKIGAAVLNGNDDSKKIEFLKQNPYLQVDTKFFSTEFKYKLIATIENLDEQTNGLLINSDNFHALNLLQEKYKEQINCTYIDPPYNTGDDGFVYKDNYQHSSWLSMINDRLKLNNKLMHCNGKLFSSIDDKENTNLTILINEIFNKSKTICVKMSEASGVKMASVNSLGTIPKYKEYIITTSKNDLKGYIFENIEKKQWDNEYNKFIENFSKEDRVEINKNINFATPDILIAINKRLINSHFISLTEAYRKYKMDNETLEQFKFNNSWRIVRTAASSSVLKLVKENDIKQNLYAVSSSRDKKLYLVDGKYNKDSSSPRIQILFADDNLSTHPGDIWLDISTTGLEVEGGVSFKNGKKPLKLLKRIIKSVTNDDRNIVLDYFSGSGSTGSATIELNRDDNRNRKYILVEMGKYFNTATKPRIQKTIYSKNWTEERPVDRNGISQIVKYMSLESYEDACNNLQKKEQQIKLDASVEEQYKLNYMFDFEYSDSLLSIDMFKNPFDYKMNITQGNETKLVNVDLVETFNYLIGLNVNSMYFKDGFMVIEGTNRDDENIIVIWRNIEEKSNQDLNSFLEKRKISAVDFEFDKIYVNGDNNIQNANIGENQYKVILIEEEFRNRMFDMQEV